MNTSSNSTYGDINRTLNDCNWNIHCRYSSPAPGQCSSVASFYFKEEHNESTSSECTSARLAKGRWSTIEPSAEDESMSYRTDTIPFQGTDSYEIQQMQPSTTPLYIPFIHNQEHHSQRGYAYAPLRETSFKVAPVQEQSIPMSSPLSQHVHLMHKWQPKPEDLSPIPISPEATPPIMSLLSYPQQSHAQVTASVISSAVSTPVFSSVSADTNDYDHLNTPLISSASCTPMQCPVTHLDLPPVLNLNNTNGNTFSKRISCNGNMAQAQAGRQNFPGKSAPMSSLPFRHSMRNNYMSTANSFSYFSAKAEENIENKFSESYEEENVWSGSCKYEKYLHNGASNLFITWSGSKAELVEKLRRFNLEVQDVYRTNDDNIFNVIFESHRLARRAFTHQHQVGLRIVPPRNSRLNWFRNPSPKFPVKFEAKCRLVVKNGKAESHAIVGKLLKGCLIWADQLKGRRIRVASCEGKFMFPGGKIVEMKGLPHMSPEKSSLGWITYRCKHTKELLIKRRSWHLLSDYILDA